MDDGRLIAPCRRCGCENPRWDCMNDVVWYYCPSCGATGGEAASKDEALSMWDAMPDAVAEKLEREAAKTAGGPSREWLERAGDAEDRVPGGPSVGGLAVDLGLYKADAPAAPGHGSLVGREFVRRFKAIGVRTMGGVEYVEWETPDGDRGGFARGEFLNRYEPAPRDESRLRDEAAAVLAGLDEIDELAESSHGDPAWWALEDIFRRLRDRLRAAMAGGGEG